MRLYLNKKQSEKLADFFLDLAKGLLLGGIGFTAVAPFQVKLNIVFLSTSVALWCLKMALSLLQD